MKTLRELSRSRAFGFFTMALLVVVVTADDLLARGMIGGRP